MNNKRQGLVRLEKIYNDFLYGYISEEQARKQESILTKKYKIKRIIYDRYKYRTYIKAKEFKLLNKHMTKNITTEQLGYFALVGLVNSINNFDPASPVNFARVSDKYINANLVEGTLKIMTRNKRNIDKFKN